MYRTYCVLALVALYAGLAHSSWDIVVSVGNRLEFLDNNGRLTHTEQLTWNDTIYRTTYDPVHNRVLFSDLYNIYSFDITTNKTECLRNTNRYVSVLTYDPATELLFWAENYKEIYAFSLKPESNNSKVIEKRLILKNDFLIIAVDSCGGFIYWKEDSRVFRVRINGSKSEYVFYNVEYIYSLTIDQHSQKIYWSESTGSIKSADLNGKYIRTVIESTHTRIYEYLTVSQDFIYCAYHQDEDQTYYIMQIPKNSSHSHRRGINMKPKIFRQLTDLWYMAANYNIEDITQENQNCKSLKSLLPNDSVSTDNPVSQLYVHGTNASGESRCECAQGERSDVSVCHNYCLHGDCSASAEGQPKCRCNPGYSGERCEVNVCQGYCINDGVCSISEESKPLCRCTGHYEGERCEFPVFLIKCSKTVSMLRDILNTDVTSDKWVKSSCSSTAV